MDAYLLVSVVFWIIVRAGDIQASPNKYFRERQVIEIQKFPVQAKVIMDRGSEIRAPN